MLLHSIRIKNWLCTLLLLASLCFTVACNNEAPVNTAAFEAATIDEETMINVLIDIHLAEAVVQEGRFKKNAADLKDIRSYYDDVFEIYKITPEQFTEAFKHYSNQPEKFDKMYEELIDRMSKIETELQAKK